VANDLLSGTGVLLENKENALWDLEKAEFPVTLYDRPGLALSNLLLRGDVDAATRSIFSPQTLTPTEMRTISRELLGDKPNPLLKTLADVVTNPFVLLGVVMAIKYPIGKSNALSIIEKGLLKGKPPGYYMSGVHSAFNNLRNIPNAFRTLFRFGRSAGNFQHKYATKVNEAWINTEKVLGRTITEKEKFHISEVLQGFNEAPKKVAKMGTGLFAKTPLIGKDGKVVMGLEPLHGLRKALYQVYKVVPENMPIHPGLQGQMNPKVWRLAQKMRGIYDDVWRNLRPGSKEFKQFQSEMGLKGVFVNEYFPISARYGRFEGVAMRQLLGKKQYSVALEKARGHVAGAMKAAQGNTIGDLGQIRKMEKYGMPPVADKLVSAVGKDVDRMKVFVAEAWRSVQDMDKISKRDTQFMLTVMDKAKKARINTRLRIGPGKVGEAALREVSQQLSAVSRDPSKLGAKIDDIARVLSMPAQYDMHPITATQRYLTQMASSYAYHLQRVGVPALVKGGEPTTAVGYKRLLEPIIKEAESIAGKGGWQHVYLTDQLIPMMRGLKPHRAFNRAVSMGWYKDAARTWLHTHPLPQKYLSKGTMETLDKYFGNFSSLGSESLGAKVSEFFYVSTLGLNLAPATKNLLQNYITLLHMPGVNRQGLLAGMKEMSKNVGKYSSHLSKGMSREKAWGLAFKDYNAAMGRASGMTHAMKLGDLAKEGAGISLMGKGGWEKTKDIMLTPFSTSEAFNRLFGFYVGKHSKLAIGASHAEALNFGAVVNHVAHFPGGPLGMPRALLGMWGPARQFMHFPLRYAGFLSGSTQWGTGLGKARTLATSAGASAAAYTAAKNLLGVDISQGLMYGALPMPQYEKSPFYPWPLVPPIAAVGGEVVRAAATGEAGSLTRTAALLAPGGIALRRLYKTLGPKYADYKNPTEDGRVPVYNDKRALIGAFTPWQLTMKSLGLAPTSQQAEYGAAKWLLTQREKIRAFRRDFLEAISDNDIRKSEKINRDFQKAYPELGPLQVKKTDITAIHNRREVSRLQRILKGFPKAYQPLFGHMISQSGLSEMTEQLESRPSAIDQYGPLMSQ
jgi:hypothetical protein